MSVLEYQRAPLADAAPDIGKPHGYWLLWAIYLAMSWTWCIGMFLPVLLVRDYGVWGWIIFTVPNVVGAAAMGWAIHRAADSTAIVRAHRSMVLFFSGVTTTFQLYFAAWIFRRMELDWLVPVTVVAAFAFVFFPASRDARWTRLAAVATLLVSLLCIGLALSRLLPVIVSPPRLGDGELHLMALGPVMLFGFILCPYLDTTFHHARQHLGRRDARLAFSAGFGVIFLVMIVFSLLYARRVENISTLGPLLGAALAVHFAVQLAFTTGIHWHGGGSLQGPAFWRRVVLAVLTSALGVGAYWLSDLVHELRLASDFPARSGGETLYRLFMGFYGLVFPAYVWLCMIPSPRAAPSRRSLIVCAAAILLAAPMFWLGFIEGRMIWLLPGLAIVLAARVLLPRRETSAKM